MLIACGFIWGSQYVVNTFALIHFSPLWIAFFRSGIGAVFLTCLCYYKNYKRESSYSWRILLLIALLEVTLPLLLVSWGQQTTHAAFAAIITGTIPLCTILLAPIMLQNEHLTLPKITGVLLGLMSLLYLYWPQLIQNNIKAFWGPLAILISAFCFAPCMIIIRGLGKINPIVLSRDMLLVATFQLMIILLCTHPELPANISLSLIAPIIYLGIFCGGIVYILFMWLIVNKGPAFASFSNYIVPAVGVFLSGILSNSPLDSRIIVSLSGIFLSLFICQMSQQ